MSALDKQIGGSHYKDMAIQPIEYIHKNGLGFCEGNIVKYITRWKTKNGIEDLRKSHPLRRAADTDGARQCRR
jgi:hypothetical protein